MAKKKPMFGVSNYHKRTPKKRPGRIRKKYGPGVKRPKKYRGPGALVKPIMITLMYLTFGGDIKLDTVLKYKIAVIRGGQLMLCRMKKEKRLLCLIITTTCIIKKELLAICAMVMVESRLLYNALQPIGYIQLIFIY